MITSTASLKLGFVTLSGTIAHSTVLSDIPDFLKQWLLWNGISINIAVEIENLGIYSLSSRQQSALLLRVSDT